MQPEALRRIISDTIGSVGPSPALYLSGGVDSSILLYELLQKISRETLHVFTAEFIVEHDELIKANKVMDHFVVVENGYCVQIDIKEMLNKDLPNILKYFPAPRWNVWPWYMARAAKAAGCKTVYIGEGSDEIFGGYPDRDYLHGWASQINYVRYTYDVVHKAFDLNLKAPFCDLNWVQLLRENAYMPPYKTMLKDAYRGIIPDWILDNNSQPPAAKTYLDKIGPTELEKIACKAWLEVHDV